MIEKQPLYINVIELIKEKAKRVRSDPQAGKSLVELGELLQKSTFCPTDQLVILRLLDGVALSLSSEGGERMAKIFLKQLIEDIEGPAVPVSTRLGRTA